MTEAAVFAGDDALTGDAVCAVVVPKDSAEVTPQEITAWCRSTLAHHKVPTSWLVVHDPLPRTASGKLVKSEIRRLAEEAR